jgi:hypothetical protein
MLARILLLVAIACALTGAQKSASMELVIGTYCEGSNITEPRPAQSQYFKTQLGAFQLIQGFAGYKWFIEVIKHPEKRIYTRSIVENPEDAKKPFVYESTIDPDTPSTVITHGPALGLKIYSDYTLEWAHRLRRRAADEGDRPAHAENPQLRQHDGPKTEVVQWHEDEGHGHSKGKRDVTGF